MKAVHVPRINGRYWTAILLASVAGTNLGDLYAHTLHLGIVKGLLVLAVLAAVVLAAERLADAGGELYFWLLILIIRTGATNIADYSMYHFRVPDGWLMAALAALMALLGWVAANNRREDLLNGSPFNTGLAYWLAMLCAGVFGTVAGDGCEDLIGKGVASIVLLVLLGAVLLVAKRFAASVFAAYWLVIAVARTAGTAVGDWLAESKELHLGLPFATLLSCSTFVAVLLLWRRQAVRA